ncbi:MAG TPA: phosphotransferase [Mycobacteriales bacterium]|nr:phosphotransferase [Mycobacteriales bacterium]
MTLPLLASGRDADIYVLDDNRVLRRSRDRRPLTHEAIAMEAARKAGFPAPVVHELRADDSELVMDRVDGPLMMDLLVKRPHRMPALAVMLAQLHRRLGAIDAPAELPALPEGGSKLVHLDLHPLNVIMSPSGPVVIDWASASQGRPETDVASTWVILASSEAPGGRLATTVAGLGRQMFLNAFLRATGQKQAARAMLPPVISARLLGRNLVAGERRYLERWLERLPSPTGSAG